MAVDGFRPRPGVVAACPWCGSTHTRQVGAFASVAMTAHFMCRECNSPFEWVRWRPRAAATTQPNGAAQTR